MPVRAAQAWSPFFTWSLRQRLPDAVIVANSAGALSDSALNGLTIEMEACVDYVACSNAIEGQLAVAAQPPVGVMWLTHRYVKRPWFKGRANSWIALTIPSFRCAARSCRRRSSASVSRSCSNGFRGYSRAPISLMAPTLCAQVSERGV